MLLIRSKELIQFMKLSIIIPAWNEAGKIGSDIRAIDQHIKNSDASVELIIVDDGSTDDTSHIAKDTPVSNKLVLNVISQAVHRGKGYAIRKGIEKSMGDNVMFMDSMAKGLTVGLLLKGNEKNVKVRLAKMPEHLKKMLDSTNIIKVFPEMYAD